MNDILKNYKEIIINQNKKENLLEIYKLYEEEKILKQNEKENILLLGILYFKIEKYVKSLEFFEKLEENKTILFNKGMIYLKLKNYDKALIIFNKIYNKEEKDYLIEFQIGYCLLNLKNFEESKKILNNIIEKTNDSNIKELSYYNLGYNFHINENFSDAIINYQKAIEINKNNNSARSNLIEIYRVKKEYVKAFENIDFALKINPYELQIINSAGLILMEKEKFEDALIKFEQIIKLNKCHHDANVNINIVRFLKGDYLKALENFTEILKFVKKEEINKYILIIKLFICEWSGLTQLREEIIKEIKNKNYIDPIKLMLIIDDDEIHLKNQLNNKSIYIKNTNFNNNKVKNGEKIKIGYFSPDFRYHPVSIWLIEQIENHDKSKFELYGFSFRDNYKDPMQQRIQNGLDYFIEVDKISDFEVAKLSRKLGINIAIDLCGQTQGSRPGIFAERAAPIQINHLGFPGTTGSTYIDYILTDKNTIPEESQKYFSEKILYVPCLYTYDRQRKVSNKNYSPTDYGLPDNKFIFTCQNGVYKILPELFDVWMDILKAIPNSILWLQESNINATINLKKEAEIRGINSERLFFQKREKVEWSYEQDRIEKYLASYKNADLFLDTFPYNGGTTVVDALSTGLPVITMRGNSVVSRMATSALYALQMPELVVGNLVEYKDLAIQLALEPEKLKDIKNKLSININTKSLFKQEENTRYIEDVYIDLLEKD
jgi:predicted O-linked N-acetylglucosamine transferase (SPINDLY family)